MPRLPRLPRQPKPRRQSTPSGSFDALLVVSDSLGIFLGIEETKDKPYFKTTDQQDGLLVKGRAVDSVVSLHAVQCKLRGELLDNPT